MSGRHIALVIVKLVLAVGLAWVLLLAFAVLATKPGFRTRTTKKWRPGGKRLISQRRNPRCCRSCSPS
jgi:hypothetical protein